MIIKIFEELCKNDFFIKNKYDVVYHETYDNITHNHIIIKKKEKSLENLHYNPDDFTDYKNKYYFEIICINYITHTQININLYNNNNVKQPKMMPFYYSENIFFAPNTEKIINFIKDTEFSLFDKSLELNVIPYNKCTCKKGIFDKYFS